MANVSIKTLRKYATNSTAIDNGFNNKQPVFYWFGELLEYRFADKCDGGPDHTGWYTNEHGETFRDGFGLCRGVVVCLPACPGYPDGRFLAGYWWGDNGEFVLWPELYRDESEAAREADSHAESFADTAREDNARFNAMREAEDEVEEKAKACRLAVMARNVSEDHRAIAREAIEALKEARMVLQEATTAYDEN